MIEYPPFYVSLFLEKIFQAGLVLRLIR